MALATFNGLMLREADQLADVERLAEWIEADPAHRGITSPYFFMSGKLALEPRSNCYALEDEHGVVFYIRLARAARTHIQFAPEGDIAQKSRVMRALFHGMAFLESQLAHAGCEEWIFNTNAPRLKRIIERVLGFTQSTHEMVRAIAAPRATGKDVN